MVGVNRTPVAGRFWVKVDIRGEDDCWLWLAGTFHKGYGKFSINGVPNRAPRVAWELTYGPIPEGMLVCHECDNPPCVNPNHLFLGTYQSNVDDMIEKGRENFFFGRR